MSSIVIALPQIEDAKKIRAVLERHGFIVASVCTTASNALSSASELGSGVLICSHRLPDMNYLDLSECMPREFEMLLLASARVICEVPTSILSVQMPIKASDLVNTVNMILTQQERRRRKEKQKPKIKEKTIVKKHIQPDTAAIIFTLTNGNPDRWKNRQDSNISGLTPVSTVAPITDEQVEDFCYREKQK